jgi:hypothetical protein
LPFCLCTHHFRPHPKISTPAVRGKTPTEFLADFRAEAIDNGSLWSRWAGRVSPETRVDRSLLDSLRRLDEWLQANGSDDPAVSAIECEQVRRGPCPVFQFEAKRLRSTASLRATPTSRITILHSLLVFC